MKAVYRWIAAHPGLSKFLIALFVTFFGMVTMHPDIVPFGIRYLVIFLMLFYGYLFVNTIADKLMKQPLEILEQQCDPYPFLEEMELQQSRCKDNFQGQLTRINYAMALVQTGQNEKAVEVLESINIDRFPSISPFVKFVYYNNLCDVMTRLERFSEANIWYEKSRMIYQDLPDNKMKRSMDRTAKMNEIEHLYREGDYQLALRKLSWLPCNTPRSVMDGALLAARCNFALGEYDKAREKLEYVVANANRLASARDASELLEKLP